MNRTNKTILSFVLLLTIFITNASEELLRQLSREVNPNQAQKKARMFLKGDKRKCIELFQEALKEDNSVAQIYLANTHTTMGWAQDHEKDFSEGIKEDQLESYNIAPNAMELLEWMHEKADPRLHNDWKKRKKAVHRTINQAQKIENVYAQFLQVLGKKSNITPYHFGLACKLKPLIDHTQFSELLFTFGASLFNSGRYNSQLELEGLKYKEKSGFLNLKFFEDEKNYFFGNFNTYCSNSLDPSDKYYDKYGMRFVRDNTILVPSREHWRKFKEKKLETVQSSPDHLFDLFKEHDMDKIYSLTKKYKLEFLSSEKEGLPCLDVYYTEWEKTKNFGKIGLTNIESKNIRVNIQPDLPPKIIKELSPVINFLRGALSRCGDSLAVYYIMRDLTDK